jgi:hypothetical protein
MTLGLIGDDPNGKWNAASAHYCQITFKIVSKEDRFSPKEQVPSHAEMGLGLPRE